MSATTPPSGAAGGGAPMRPVIVDTPTLPSSLAVAAVAVSAVFTSLAIIAVALRYYAQRHSKRTFPPDTIVLTAALVVVVALGILTIWAATTAGLGWPGPLLLGPAGILFLRAVFAGQILWGASIALIRAGLLLFYRRIFVTPKFKVVSLIVLVINGAWFLTYLIGTMFTYRWTRTVQNTINYPAWLISHSVLDVVQDLVTLCLPLFVIRNLNMSRRKKFLLSGVFLLGTFCVIASMVRLKYFVDLTRMEESNRQYSDTTFNCYIWSVVQPCMSLIAACLPSYGPAFTDGRFLKSLYSSAMSLLSSRSRRSRPSGRSTGTDQNHTVEPHGTAAWSKIYAASDEGLQEPTGRERIEMLPTHVDRRW